MSDVTQPPIVPGPYDPSQGWEPTSQPPVVPPQQPAYPPPQLIYVQVPAQQEPSSRAVAGGIGIALHWILIVVIGVPVLCCLGALLIGALGKK